ncbi:hypothetical protein MTO96_016533 [Rhipicephalus appendiculatus]
MQTTTPVSQGPASPCSSLSTDEARPSKAKHSNSHGFNKMTSLSSLQHPLQYRTPAGNERPVHDVHAGSRPAPPKTPPSPETAYPDLFKTKSSTEKGTGSTSGCRMALGLGGGLSTPYRLEIARDFSNTHSKTPEPPFTYWPGFTVQVSLSRDLSKTRSSAGKSTGSTSGFRMALCMGGGLSTPYRLENVGDFSNTHSKTPQNPPSPYRSKNAGNFSNTYPKTPEPPLPVALDSQSSLQWLRCSVEKNSASLSDLKASLAAVAQQSPVSQHSTQRSTALALGTYSDTSGSTHAYRSSTQGCRGITPGSNTQGSRGITPGSFLMLGETPPLFRKCKEDPSLFKVRLEISDDEDESDEEKRKPDIPSMKRGSSCPKPGRMPSKASHGARAQGAALSSSRPCKAASIKSDSRSDEGSGRPVKDGASGRRPCRTSHEENNGVQHSHQLEAQQVLKVSRHSKKKSLLSVLLDVKPPTEDFYIEINEKRYHMLSLIGRGGSSKVFMMFDHQKELRAVKLVNLADVPPSVMQAYMQEVAILKELRSCDRVVCLFDCELNKKDNVLALVMEKGDQDLATVLMNRKGNLGPVTIKFYWSEMLQAVKEIHDKRVVHSDLKPANFLFVAGKLKLIDFGIANKIQEDVTSVLKESPMGTLNFMSPESIKYTSQKQGKDYLKIGLKSDVWSLGCILYNLVYGKTPFQHISATAAKLLAIVDKKQPIDFPDVPDPHLMDVLTKCLQRDPEQRPSISKLLEHPYLVEEVMPLPGKQCMDPHVQSLINEIENLSPRKCQENGGGAKGNAEGQTLTFHRMA